VRGYCIENLARLGGVRSSVVRAARWWNTLAVVVAVVVVVVVKAVVVALVAAVAPLLQLNSKSIFYTFLRRLSASRPTTSYLAVV
jgi:hypothetical protein